MDAAAPNRSLCCRGGAELCPPDWAGPHTLQTPKCPDEELGGGWGQTQGPSHLDSRRTFLSRHHTDTQLLLLGESGEWGGLEAGDKHRADLSNSVSGGHTQGRGDTLTPVPVPTLHEEMMVLGGGPQRPGAEGI